MPMKSKYKRRILWFSILFVGLMVLAVFIVPPMVTMNSLKPKIENTIFSQTGVPVKINGDINFSLLGKATIVAHNLSVPNGTISSCEFAIPLKSIFNVENTDIFGNINIQGANLSIEKITPYDIDTDIVINNSQLKFLNKTYDIISANLSKKSVSAIVRTDQHKYEIKSLDNNFTIKNKNNDLILSGTLFPNGTAVAHISITAQNINRWFEFKSPKIRGSFPVTADMTWNGSYGIDFTNVSAKGISGNIYLQQDGYKIIKLENKNADYDMSFILKDTEFLKNASLDLNFYGKIKFSNKTFEHLHINTIGDKAKIAVKKIILDDMLIQHGYIDETGAHNIDLTLPVNDIKTTCEFDGTPTHWYCKKFSYGNTISGDLEVTTEKFFAHVKSKYNLNDINKLVQSFRKFGDNGKIEFVFANMGGTIFVNPKNYTVEYQFANNKNLNWAKIGMPFFPEFILQEYGDFVWAKDSVSFVPKSKTWYLQLNKDNFLLGGDDFRKWFPNTDLQTIVAVPYVISGNYKNGNISDLELDMIKQKFHGSASGKNFTLKTDMLNIDAFLSKKYRNNREQMFFFISHPITIPFDLPINLSLVAKTLIYNGHAYNNFVYSSRNNTQIFSITDSDRGNILATLEKDKINYSINIQLNKFIWDEKLLPNNMPLNLSNTSITAEIKLKTFGKIAHDMIENINGTFDASFDGGILYGLGISDFYASAQNINLLNVEYVLQKALESGTSPIKKMHIVGTYDNGNIKTTSPLTLAIKHSDITGDLEITDKKMFARLDLILRGTSVDPQPIELIINDKKRREYSLSDIMMNFDSEYMRAFIQTHNKF